MSKKSNFTHFLCLAALAAATVFAAGNLTQVSAQRDPFQKPGYMKPKAVSSGPAKPSAPAAAVNYGPPAIEARIEYFKRLRETAAANGAPLPKVTSVLTLNEMAVTGIFKTPRGYAAIVEAGPPRLSFTIYPGGKFFYGPLVAGREKRLVFRRGSQMSKRQFISLLLNKALWK